MLFDYFLTAAAADYFYIMRYGEDGFAVVRAAAKQRGSRLLNYYVQVWQFSIFRTISAAKRSISAHNKNKHRHPQSSPPSSVVCHPSSSTRINKY